MTLHNPDIEIAHSVGYYRLCSGGHCIDSYSELFSEEYDSESGVAEDGALSEEEDEQLPG